jgi:Short C-terminal domain
MAMFVLVVDTSLMNVSISAAFILIGPARPERPSSSKQHEKRLANLKDRGILTEAEFAAEKMKIPGPLS